MFKFSVFPVTFRIRSQNFTSNFHNLGNFFPISTWNTSMNLWLNSLTFYIKIFLFDEGRNFNPFSCSNFRMEFFTTIIIIIFLRVSVQALIDFLAAIGSRTFCGSESELRQLWPAYRFLYCVPSNLHCQFMAQ